MLIVGKKTSIRRDCDCLAYNFGHKNVGKKTSIRRDCDTSKSIILEIRSVGKKTSIRRDCDR